MDGPVIRKRVAAPNLGDYDTICRNFSWGTARAELVGLLGGGLNIAYEALAPHVAKGCGGRLAIRWLGKNGGTRDFTYADPSAANAGHSSPRRSFAQKDRHERARKRLPQAALPIGVE